jgi:hypothetical protein
MLAKTQAAGVQAPSEGFAYMLGQSTEGHRYMSAHVRTQQRKRKALNVLTLSIRHRNANIINL